MGVGNFFRQWNAHAFVTVFLIALLSLTVVACENEPEPVDSGTVDNGDTSDNASNEPDNGTSAGGEGESGSDSGDSGDGGAGSGDSGSGETGGASGPTPPPQNLVVDRTIPSDLIINNPQCFNADQSLSAVVRVFDASIHTPASDPNIVLVKTVPVGLSTIGTYSYHVSFDQASTFTLYLSCGDSSLVLLMNTMVIDNIDGQTLADMTLTPDHIATHTECSSCQFVNDQQRVAILDYSESMIDHCNACHDGNAAVGKQLGHVVTEMSCQQCHESHVWQILDLNHDNVAGMSCVNCHDGTIASGKSSLHINSDDECQACHETAPAPWAPVPPENVDHSHVIGSCADCHCGGSIQLGINCMGDTHPQTNEDCGVCHSTNVWLPLLSDHSLMTDNCIACHDGTNASGKANNHIETTDICEACHEKPPALWAPVLPDNVDHNEVLGTCASCHVCVIGPCNHPVSHQGFADDCAACHQPPTWLPTQVDHSLTTANCIACHNGTDASGKTPSHINSTDICEACHAPAPVPWIPVYTAHVDHNEVIGACSSCHDGCIWGCNIPPFSHIGFVDDCDACHQPPSWLPTVVNHSLTTANCAVCHDNVNATGKNLMHMFTLDDCSLCHGVDAWIPSTIDHATFIENCVECHDGTSASGKSPNHILSSDNCQSCHELFPATWAPVRSSNVDHHEVIGSCASCHDGCIISCPPHPINTTNECVACHNTTSWIPVDSVNHDEVLGECSDCHNGVIATGKSDTHIATLFECDVCHTTNRWLIN